MKHMHTTSLGLAKAVWLHNTQLTTKHKYQHKHDNSRHSLQNTCMQKTSAELFAAGCLHCLLDLTTHSKKPHAKMQDIDHYSGHERGNIPRKTPFFARRWTWRIFSKHKKHDTEVRLYSYVCSLGFNAWSALAQKYTGCWQSSWSCKSLKSDFILFVSQVIFHSWWL